MKKIRYKGERQRLDTYVSGLLDITRSQAQKKIRAGNIKIGGKSVNPGKILIQGDIITTLPAEGATLCRKKPAPEIKILYEDENIIVVDKEAGVVVYPSYGHESGTLLDALRGKIQIEGSERPGVVHRLDKDTSGLIAFAKNEKAERELKKIIKERKFEKTYLALVWGKVTPKKGRIEIPIKRAERDRKKMEAAKIGRKSLTEYEVLRYYDNMTLLKVRIITGRTHQIRVHFSAIGYPVVGDKTYGPRFSVIPARQGSGKRPAGISPQLSRQFLHAHELAFELFGKKYRFKSDLPEDLKGFIKSI